LPLSPIILSDPPAFLGAETIPPASPGTAGLSALPSVVTASASDIGVTHTENLVAQSPLSSTLTPFSPLRLANRDEFNEMGSGPPIQQGKIVVFIITTDISEEFGFPMTQDKAMPIYPLSPILHCPSRPLFWPHLRRH
jgi:hypothetical protein